jgi:hypothetical protein
MMRRGRHAGDGEETNPVSKEKGGEWRGEGIEGRGERKKGGGRRSERDGGKKRWRGECKE